MLERMIGMWILAIVNLALGDSGLNLHSGIKGGKKHRKSDDSACPSPEQKKEFIVQERIINPLMPSSGKYVICKVRLAPRKVP